MYDRRRRCGLSLLYYFAALSPTTIIMTLLLALTPCPPGGLLDLFSFDDFCLLTGIVLEIAFVPFFFGSHALLLMAIARRLRRDPAHSLTQASTLLGGLLAPMAGFPLLNDTPHYYWGDILTLAAAGAVIGFLIGRVWDEDEFSSG